MTSVESSTTSIVKAEVLLPLAEARRLYQASDEAITTAVVEDKFIDQALKLLARQPNEELEDLIKAYRPDDFDPEWLVLTHKNAPIADGFKVEFVSDHPTLSSGEVAVFGVVRYCRDLIIAGNGKAHADSSNRNHSAFAAKISPYIYKHAGPQTADIVIIERDEQVDRAEAAQIIIKNLGHTVLSR